METVCTEKPSGTYLCNNMQICNRNSFVDFFLQKSNDQTEYLKAKMNLQMYW